MALTLVVHLVRHGQSEWNLLGRLQGQTPHPALSPLGRQQAVAVADTLASAGRIDRLLTSDLVRAVQTAEPIAAACGVSAVLDVRLREQAMGDLEGLPSAAAFTAAAGLDWSDPATRLGGAASESVQDVYQRVGGLLASLITAPEVSTAVLVSHGDTIRIAARWLTDTSPAAEFDADGLVLANGSITTARLTDGILVELTTTVP